MERDFLPVFLKATLPVFDWILSDMEKSHGWLNLPPLLIENIIRLKLSWWPAYENERLFGIYRLLMFVDFETLRGIKNQQDAEELKVFLLNDAYEFITSEEYGELRDCQPLTEQEKNEISLKINNWLNDLTEEERKEFWRDVSFYWLGYFSNLFDVLAVMIHGRSMRQLVADAKNGDDWAFVSAIQIDRMVMFLPYFQERILRAQVGKEADLLDKIGYRVKNPIIRGKIRRRTLWLLFALLESEDKLDMPLTQLLALCQDVGVYGDKFGVGDENSLGKRKREYFKNRGTRKYF